MYLNASRECRTGLIIPPEREIEVSGSALLDFASTPDDFRLLSTHDSRPSRPRLKIATDTPRLLGLAIQLWTIPAQVVQIDIANFGDQNHPGVSSGGKRDRDPPESRRSSSVAERSRVAPPGPP